MKTLITKTRLHLLLTVVTASLLLLFPKQCSLGVRLGIDIALSSLIPALLPFLLFSNYILRSGDCVLIGRLFHPVCKRLFKTSENGSYAVALGFLCGYPLGAKITAELVRTGQISVRQGNYLFSFINNPSPAFLLCYVSPLICMSKKTMAAALLLLYLPSFLIGLCSPHPDFSEETTAKRQTISIPFSKLIDDSIFNAFLTLAKLTGYLIIFSVFATLVSNLSLFPTKTGQLLCGILEITSGIYGISVSSFSPLAKYLLSILFSISGGLAVLFQINSVIFSSGLRLSVYIKYKLISVVLCIILFLLLLALPFHFFA